MSRSYLSRALFDLSKLPSASDILKEYERKNIALKQLSGYDITELVKLFAAGYTLTPPEYQINMLSTDDIFRKEN